MRRPKTKRSSPVDSISITDAKTRLDKLIRKARVHLYKPIQIAEILYRYRVIKDIEITKLETYRRPSARWRNEVIHATLGRIPSLNSRYEDQLFDEEILPPKALMSLADVNNEASVVEAYIYHHLLERNRILIEIESILKATAPKTFQLTKLLEMFEANPELRRSVDKIYEIVVYALFNAITKHLRATVTLSVSDETDDILADFEEFTQKVLGISKDRKQISVAAKLFRVGATNVNDAGLDMWANFGPAVQVKHLTLQSDQVGELSEEVNADQCVIVCKKIESKTIKNVIKQLDLEKKIRGIIVETDLIRWYNMSMSEKYCKTIGSDLLSELHREYISEFPVNSKIRAFLRERGYKRGLLKGDWQIHAKERGSSTTQQDDEGRKER